MVKIQMQEEDEQVKIDGNKYGTKVSLHVDVLPMPCMCHLGVHLSEIGVPKGFLGRDALAWFQLDHLEKEINSYLIHVDTHLF